MYVVVQRDHNASTQYLLSYVTSLSAKKGRQKKGGGLKDRWFFFSSCITFLSGTSYLISLYNQEPLYIKRACGAPAPPPFWCSRDPAAPTQIRNIDVQMYGVHATIHLQSTEPVSMYVR